MSLTPLTGLQVEITITPVANADSYVVYRAGEGGFSDKENIVVLGTIVSPDTTFLDDSVEQGGIYTYRVRARRSDGTYFKSRYSEEVIVLSDTLAVPANFVVTAADAQVAASWNAVSGAEQYVLTYDTDPSFSSPTTAYTGTNLSVTVGSLVNGTTYYFRIQATSSITGDSPQSTNRAVTPTATPTLSTPTNLSVAETGVEGNVTFSWAATPFAEQYEVYLNDVLQETVATTSRSFTGLTAGTPYKFSVIAKDTDLVYEDSLSADFTYIPQSAGNDEITFESVGANAYYKPMDGRLEDPTQYGLVGSQIQYPLINYTPYSVDNTITNGTGLVGTNYTKITAAGGETLFEADDLNKRFCGLFAHKNPLTSDPVQTDLYFPGIIGSRYCNVVHVIDAQNIIVDFEFNGGNSTTPQTITGGKGYIFFDNSTAWENLKNTFLDANRTETKTRILPISFGANYKITRYVIPTYYTWSFSPTKNNFRMWTGSSVRGHLKFGIEDYYQHESFTGKQGYAQDQFIYATGVSNTVDLNAHWHNVVHLSPHRVIAEMESKRRSMFTGRFRAGVIAFFNDYKLDEQRAIDRANARTQESEHTIYGNNAYADGVVSGVGLAARVTDFGFVYVDGYEQRGPYFHQMNANGGGGAAFVAVDADVKYDEEVIQPSAKYLDFRVKTVNPFDDFEADLKQWAIDRGYPPYVLELTSNDSWYSYNGGAPGATMIFTENAVWDHHKQQDTQSGWHLGTFKNYWDFCWGPEIKDPSKWNNAEGFRRGAMTSRHLMLAEHIPQVGESYWVSHDYTAPLINFNNLMGNNGDALIPPLETITKRGANAIRSAVCWSTILQKYGVDMVPGDCPANGQPVGLQPGDQFKIKAYPGSTHDPNEIYTCDNKQRGQTESYEREFLLAPNGAAMPAGYSHINGQSYHFWTFWLDKPLPVDLPLAFEIEIVTSVSAYLLDGTSRPGAISRKANGRLGGATSSIPTKNLWVPESGNGMVIGHFFPEPYIIGNPVGHWCYTHKEVYQYWKNVNAHGGYYRQNNNGGAGFSKYSVTDDEGAVIQSHPPARWSQGRYMINCTGLSFSQFITNLVDYQRIHWAERELDPNYPTTVPESDWPKMRFYNTVNPYEGNMSEFGDPDKFFESYVDDSTAPPPPAACTAVKTAIESELP